LKFEEGIVPSRFAVLSRFGVKFVEVAGAGLASALCAYFLGQIGQQPAPPPVAQVLPASADAIRSARDDHAPLAMLARKDVDSATTPEQAAPAPTAASGPKPARPAPAVHARRNHTAEQAGPGEPQPRATGPMPIQPPIAAFNPGSKPAAQTSPTPLGGDGLAASGASRNEDEQPLFARLKLIPSWFLPDNDRIFGVVPRPPMPVGEFFHSAM
jgi:hypothetical protein